MGAQQVGSSRSRRRSDLRTVAVPTEHGGWALTLEPAVLGLLVAPSVAGVALALAAVVAFVARTPVRVVLVDLWRRRRLRRTVVAARVAAAELTLLASLVVVVALTAANGSWWTPALVALPLLVVELWYDMRSRSRRLIPELLGAIAVASTVAMIALADDRSGALAAALWLVLAARVTTSVVHVRARIEALHGRAVGAGLVPLADLAAFMLAWAAVVVDERLVPGAAAIVVVVLVQRLAAGRPVRSVPILGVQQMMLGLGVVVATAVGIW